MLANQVGQIPGAAVLERHTEHLSLRDLVVGVPGRIQQAASASRLHRATEQPDRHRPVDAPARQAPVAAPFRVPHAHRGHGGCFRLQRSACSFVYGSHRDHPRRIQPGGLVHRSRCESRIFHSSHDRDSLAGPRTPARRPGQSRQPVVSARRHSRSGGQGDRPIARAMTTRVGRFQPDPFSSNSSTVCGQSFRNSRESDRSASTRPFVWHRGQ
jgi:hypothetical protein